jgi:hypothetical protein
MRKALLYIAFILLLLILLMPAVQMGFGIFREKPLQGAFNLAEKPTFTKEKWYGGQYQEGVEKYLKDHSGFRNFLVRLQNQLDYSLFSEANAEGVVVGKNRQLFEYDYIRSWLAIDYPGDSFLEKKLLRTRWVQDYLKREKGIDLVVVFEPGKASFFPEDIPDKYQKMKSGASTYERYVEKAKETGVDYIDLQQYFLQLKPGSEYPLFPATGTHWSVYGMRFAADSMLNFIDNRLGIHLGEARVGNMPISSKPLDTDDDVIKTMNLLFQGSSEKLAYPRYSFDTINQGDKPMVLVVADSYYWNIYNTRIPLHLFANEAFWYFNSLVYPDNYNQPLYTRELNFKEEIEKQDIIFLMVTERFVHKFDWSLIDQLYNLYAPSWIKDPVYDQINDIMRVESWYAYMIQKAQKKGQTLEEALVIEGKFLFKEADSANYLVKYGLEDFRHIISQDSGWMATVRQEASDKNMTVDEMLTHHAEYIFWKKSPVYFELNKNFLSVKNRIYNDPGLLETMKSEAKTYGCEPGVYIDSRAWQIFREEEILRTCNAIHADTAWLSDVAAKARNKGVPLDTMIREDAEYMLDQRLNQHN